MRMRRNIWIIISYWRVESRNMFKMSSIFHCKQKLVDTAGRIERFRKKYEKFQKQEKPN